MAATFGNPALILLLISPFSRLSFSQAVPSLVLNGIPKIYFDRLVALKNLTIYDGFRVQSGNNNKVSNDFFSHVATLRAVPGMGIILQAPHQKAFTARHGGTLEFLETQYTLERS